MDEFDMYSVDMDSECVSQDFDDIDLYAEHTLDYLKDEEDNCELLLQ